MKALNFYSTVYHGFLVCRDKTCTIRLGDKTGKYSEGDVALVTYGERFRKRKKVFTAVIDRVTVKTIGELTDRELQGESPDMHTPQDALDFLSRIYDRQLHLDDTVTVVHFSEITD
ncbi:MAG: RNA-binding protein [Bacillota bacterium]